MWFSGFVAGWAALAHTWCKKQKAPRFNHGNHLERAAGKKPEKLQEKLQNAREIHVRFL